MHQALRTIFNKSVEVLEKDDRVIACWHSGSAGNSATEDEFSDVDPIFVIKDDEFANIDRDLRPIFEAICPDIVLWWPEVGNSESAKNYAILMKTPELVQYDMNIIKESMFSAGWLASTVPEQIVFDKTGLLRSALAKAAPARYSPEKLVWHIERWWLYVYINVKYLRRQDLFKLFFVQSTLLEDHMEVLHALHPDAVWGWWPINIKHHLDKAKKAQLLQYFTANDIASLIKAVEAEMDVFAEDARLACKLHGKAYPEAFEAEIRRYAASKIRTEI